MYSMRLHVSVVAPLSQHYQHLSILVIAVVSLRQLVIGRVKMIRLIQWLFHGHIHKYEQVEVCELITQGRVIGKIYIMRCESCGEMKTFEVLI